MSLLFKKSTIVPLRRYGGVNLFRAFSCANSTFNDKSGPKQYPGEWPLPPQIEFEQEELPELRIPPLVRVNEDIDTKRARLVYQSRKRGILETDLLLSKFAKQHLPTLTSELLDEYDKLLDENDWDIFYWATYNKRRKVPEKWENSQVLGIVRKIAKNEQKEVMRMPPL